MSGLWLEPHRDAFGSAAGYLFVAPGGMRSPPSWRCELAAKQHGPDEWTLALRVARGDEPVAWLRLDDWWSYVEVLLTEGNEVSAAPPLRATEVRSLGSNPTDRAWAAFFVERQ